MSKWLCFYEENDYDKADNLYKTLYKASKAYNLNISEPKWIEMPNNSSVKDWIEKADSYFNKGSNDYSFVIFLIKNNDFLYKELKVHSLYKIGYVSQVVKSKSILKKKALSIAPKILLQINSKLGGISYKLKLDKTLEKLKLMIIGVDSSYIKGKRKGIAMVATINESFTDFFNKEEIIEEDNKNNICFCFISFLEQAIQIYKKENGVNLKSILKMVIEQIDHYLQSNNILYYYILVNKKVNFKFFERNKNTYVNPKSELLIINGITNKYFFEFYIQPQEVTQGCAIPICYHVVYGNLDFPEIIPKLTFDLCNLYSNWQGKVRVPNVLKLAEKLSKMAAKYMPNDLNQYLRLGQIYL